MTQLTKVMNGEVVPLSEAEIEEFNAREAAHVASLIQYELIKYQDQRRAEYPTVDELVIALIEKEEGRPEVLNSLMVQRLQIKNKYPKPRED